MPIVILEPTDNIFDFEDEATLVNPVNVQGYVGTLAAAFAKRYGDTLMKPYRRACLRRRLVPGGVIAIDVGVTVVLCGATKGRVENPSTYEMVEGVCQGLYEYGMRSGYPLAVPALGCGAGGLEWDAVLPILYAWLDPLPQTVYVFPPQRV